MRRISIVSNPLASLEKSMGILHRLATQKPQSVQDGVSRTGGATSFRFLLLCTVALAITGATLFFESSAFSKEPKTFKLLIMDSQEGNPYNEVRASLLKTLGQFGYVEGHNLKTVVKYSGNDIKAGERILTQEVAKSYDVVFVGGTAATISAKNILFGTSQRVVFGSPTDPVGIGVINDFVSKPNANFTGVCYPVPVKTRLRFLKSLMPKAKIFGLIYADMPQSHSYNKWLENLLKNDPEFKGIKLLLRPVPLVTGENGDRHMAANAKRFIHELDAVVDAYIKPCDQMGTRRHFSEVVYATSKRPLIGLVKDDVMGRWGATAVIYPSHESIGIQTAKMIKGLFEGKRINEITPEWPQKYGVAVDLRKAKQFGLDIPVEVLQMAGENIVR